MERAEKREFVTTLNETIKASSTIVVAHYAGLTVAQMNDYRSKMREAGGAVKVAKNRLAKIALQGTDAEGISNLFEGQTLIAYSSDPVVAAKVTNDFAGTAEYVAPEVLHDKRAGRAVDLWALGCILYECLRGKRAFGADSRCGRCEGSGHHAVAGCTAGEARRHDSDAGYAHRRGGPGACGTARTRVRGLCQEGRGGVRLVPRCSNQSSNLKEYSNG